MAAEGDNLKKLLIADDELGIRRLVRMTLESDQYEIIEAADAQEALGMARAHRPELVLLDVMMPKGTGFDVCRALKQDPETRDITVVMLTARSQKSDVAEGEGAGADDYFTKPFSPVHLVRKVDQILENGH
jgi:two-component system, OmpR family, phosphate regulon response regulator PhoB